MIKRFIVFAALFSVIALSGCSSAAGIDDVLNNAKKEGRAVMLELGSVGCIPCEQMRKAQNELQRQT
jgi:thioredoxin-related protein